MLNGGVVSGVVKVVAGVSVGLFAFGCASGARLDPQESVVAEKCARAIVALDFPGGKGTGVAISPDGKVLTAWHVVMAASSTSGSGSPDQMVYAVQLRHRGNYQGCNIAAPRLVLACPDQDLAVIDIGIRTSDYLTFSQAGPKENDRVLLVGASSGRARVVAGPYIGYAPMTNRVLLAVEAPAAKGDSGGALLNCRGEMLGIISANISRANLDKHKIELKDLAARKWVTMAVATPPQVVAEMLRLKPVLASTTCAGDPEKSWSEMTFRLTKPAGLPRLPASYPRR